MSSGSPVAAWLFISMLVLAACDQAGPDMPGALDAGVDAALDGTVDAALDGAVDGAPDAAAPAVDSGVSPLDLGPTRPCPEGWTGAPGDCAPPPLADCAPNTLALPDGTCSAPWECPAGWSPIEDGYGCAPDPMRDDCPDGSFALPDGACSAVWACPDGWRRLAPTGGCVVDPCPEGEVPLEGGGCAPLATSDCAAPEWPEDVVLIGPDAPAEALTEAIASGRPVGFLPGEHAVGVVNIERDAVILGACREQTRLTGRLRLLGGVVEVARLGVQAARGPTLVVEGAEVELEQVDIGGAVVGARGSVRGVDVAASAGRWRFVEGRLTCHRCTFTEAPLRLEQAAELTSIAVQGTFEDIAIRAPASLVLQDAQLAVAGVGISLGGAGAGHRVERCRIAGGTSGIAVRNAEQVTIGDIDVSAIGGDTAIGVQVDGATGVELTRITVRDVAASTRGYGVVLGDSTVTARDLHITGLASNGLSAGASDDAEAEVVIDGLVIEDLQPAGALNGRCITGLGAGLSLRVERALLRGCSGQGVLTDYAHFELARSRIEAVRPDGQQWASGAEVYRALTARLMDVWVANAQGTGIRLGEIAQADVARVAIEDVALGAPTMREATGLALTDGTIAVTQDVWVAGTQSIGVALDAGEWTGAGLVVDTVDALGQQQGIGVYQAPGTVARLERLAITDTQGSFWRMADGEAAPRTELVGVRAYAARERVAGALSCGFEALTGSLSLADAVIADTPFCGVGLGTGAEATLARVIIEALQRPGEESRGLRVVGGRLDATELAIQGASVGVYAVDAARVSLERFTMEAIDTSATLGETEAQIELIDGRLGSGTLQTSTGALLDARGIALQGAVSAGDDTRLVLADARIHGGAVRAESAASVVLERVIIDAPADDAPAGAARIHLSDTEARIASTVVRDGIGRGVMSAATELLIDGLRVEGMRPDAEGRADGLLVDAGALDAADLHLVDNPRAGLVVRDVAGVVRGGLIQGSRFGVVLEGAASIEDDAVVYHANERDRRECPAQCLP